MIYSLALPCMICCWSCARSYINGLNVRCNNRLYMAAHMHVACIHGVLWSSSLDKSTLMGNVFFVFCICLALVSETPILYKHVLHDIHNAWRTADAKGGVGTRVHLLFILLLHHYIQTDAPSSAQRVYLLHDLTHAASSASRKSCISFLAQVMRLHCLWALPADLRSVIIKRRDCSLGTKGSPTKMGVAEGGAQSDTWCPPQPIRCSCSIDCHAHICWIDWLRAGRTEPAATAAAAASANTANKDRSVLPPAPWSLHCRQYALLARVDSYFSATIAWPQIVPRPCLGPLSIVFLIRTF